MLKNLNFSKCVAGFSALGLLAALALGCSEQRKLDEMHDATTDMRDQTKKLGSATQDLDALTAETYDTIKQATVDARRHALTALLAAQDPARKLSEAVKYFMSFDVQLWSGLGEDTDARRLALASLAAQEFMRDVQEFIQPGQQDPLPLAGWTPGFWHEDTVNRQACFNALTVAMHENNPKQDIMLKAHPELKLITTYSLLQDALRARVLIEKGEKAPEDFPDYVKQILMFDRLAGLLVQARYNYFGALLIGQTTQIREGDHSDLGVLGLNLPHWLNLQAGLLRYHNWTLDLEKFSQTEIEEDSQFLVGGTKAHDFMQTVGITPKMDANLDSVLKHMRLSVASKANVDQIRKLHAQGTAPQPVPSEQRPRFETAFMDLFERYRDSGSPVVVTSLKPGSSSNP